MKKEKTATHEKTERNAAYIRKLNRGLEQVRNGLGVVKTMDELKKMGDESSRNSRI